MALASNIGDLTNDSPSEGESESYHSKARKSKNRKPVKRSSEDVYGDEDSDESIEDIEMTSDDDTEAVITPIERAPRSTKAAAAKKISAQLDE